WPAPLSQMSAARQFLRDCATANTPTLLLPDKDADGLCSGLIVYHALLHLGLAPENLSVHFPAKGSNIHTAPERTAIARHGAHFIIITDQGSRGGPPIVDDPAARTLIVDHHSSTEFPCGATACSAAQCLPVATSATLAYALCVPLLAESAGAGLRDRLDYLCAMGTMGDLGTGFKWAPPFPDMRECFKKWTKKVLGEAVALVNAPRRTAEFDVLSAWRALLGARSPRDLVNYATSKDVARLFEARAEVKTEVNRCARQPPTFSGDGRVALVRISSPAQVHPLIATRWSSSLKGARLEIVMCANDGYSPGMTNFACRIARAGGGVATATEGRTDIIAVLKEYASRVPGLRESMGDDFARGHKQASGGIVRTADFERLWEVMLHAEGAEGERPTKKR
ncbi:DHH phosphoesterase, partial [Trametes versicolor FP-101664 SS1]|uniref:DHH phosphoesterase n=1 Tax=Trametes versicolor (strain FP-101664) TaxID=717944 RepID=UPI0004622C0A